MDGSIVKNSEGEGGDFSTLFVEKYYSVLDDVGRWIEIVEGGLLVPFQ